MLKIEDQPIKYNDSLIQMEELVRDKQKLVWFLEYEDVIVDGKQVGRGGGQIYHGPGQRVIYFIAPLEDLAATITDLIASLEELVWLVCEKFNISAEKRLDGPGVWIDKKKVAFIGLRVNKDKWLSHGMAINLKTDLGKFKDIDICSKDKSICPGNIDIDMKKFDQELIRIMSNWNWIS